MWKRMKMDTILLVVAIVLSASLLYKIRRASPEVVETQDLRSLTEVQEVLISRGYAIESDGVYGPETKEAWSEEIFQQMLRKEGGKQ